MITSFIIKIFVMFLGSILSLMPNLTLPAIVGTGLLWVTDLIVSTLGILQLLFGTELLIAIVLVQIFKMTFDPWWWTIRWTLRQLPFPFNFK